MSNFHYAFKVKDIASTRQFYVDILGCSEGRSTEHWIDFDFFGNQLSAHVSTSIPPLDFCGMVDGIAVPIPHFGCMLEPSDFLSVQQRLEAAKVEFIVPPTLRYASKVGEQQTMFFLDFSGNPLECKSFTNPEAVFSK